MKKVFIDGSSGTTGLRIRERLEERNDLELIILPDDKRKDPEYIKEAIFASDVTFLCLPDDAAREAAALAEGSEAVIIDTSTAHRTNDAWTYGFPEINGLREKIKASKRIANPGCHASGFISLVAPLVSEGLVSPEAYLTATSLTGYSGGGKKMIAQYEEEGRNVLLDAPRQYGISQTHKHLPEMKKVCGLAHMPVFMPIVADFYSGMEVTVPLFAKDIDGTVKDIKECYKMYYNEGLVRYADGADEGGFCSAGKFSGMDSMEITVAGNESRVLLISRFDNLGKGASGAAIQNMNICLGCDEFTGLVL